MDQCLFDMSEAERRRDVGMAKACARDSRSAMLRYAKVVAVNICIDGDGTVDSDRVAMRMEAEGISYLQLGNAAGAVFRGDFEWTGECRKSSRVSTHARVIRVWRLKTARKGER